MTTHLKENADKIPPSLGDLYVHDFLDLDSFEGTWEKDGHFRSISGFMIDEDQALWGMAELDFKVYGLDERRHYLFMKLDPFIAGIAAAKMFEKAVGFLEGRKSEVTPLSKVAALNRKWTEEGFYLRGGSFNIP